MHDPAINIVHGRFAAHPSNSSSSSPFVVHADLPPAPLYLHQLIALKNLLSLA
jgi:hypothetical protein